MVLKDTLFSFFGVFFDEVLGVEENSHCQPLFSCV